MNTRNSSIVSILIFCVLLNTCPFGDACLKKIRTLIRNKGKEETPAELARDESLYTKYSHSSSDNVYIEILQSENKTFVLREYDHPPVAMSQVRQSEEPDAEYVNLNETTNGTIPTTSEAIPPERAAPEISEDEVTEEPLSPEDANIRKEWGGNCMVSDWNRCNKVREIIVQNVINNQFQTKHLELDCLLEPILCLTNGWTANRCHIICMAKCNKALFFDWDGVVDFEGPCRYRK
ncbi:hypothetical protein Ocin01_07788 [Orchesella cincta]|uniref:Uncharacterized protein n=1 Tax=Orchesella cincta TaxID=48709 RepID=A0A1D2N0S8_ORCCI|nr:hypothetical protein Ocin01_07788 [Orchesella cincta]